MQGMRSPLSRSVHDEREAYFAGEISTQEYLRRVLPDMETRPADEQDGGLVDQLRRILGRLSGKASAEPEAPQARAKD